MILEKRRQGIFSKYLGTKKSFYIFNLAHMGIFSQFIKYLGTISKHKNLMIDPSDVILDNRASLFPGC